MAADTAPAYPEVEARRHLSKKQKAELIVLQKGRCAGCGIKPRHGWEADHIHELWASGSNTLDNWQMFGSRRDCDCHKLKTAKSTTERAKMKRCRSDDERHRSRMEAKAKLSREVYKRERRSESKLQSRNDFAQRKLLSPKDDRVTKAPGSWSKPEGYVSPLSKKYRDRMKKRAT